MTTADMPEHLVAEGGVELKRVGPEHLNHAVGHRANLGFWVRTDHAGRGLATAAGRVLVREGFDSLGLGRIHLRHPPLMQVTARPTGRR